MNQFVDLTNTSFSHSLPAAGSLVCVCVFYGEGLTKNTHGGGDGGGIIILLTHVYVRRG